MNTIVVGYDGSETADRAAREAAALANDLDSILHIVFAIKRGQAVRVYGPEAWTIGGIDDAEQAVASLAGTLGVETTSSVSYDPPAEALVAEANRVDARFIVVGNKRTSGISRVLGSVAGDVIRHADCAVYVAHTT